MYLDQGGGFVEVSGLRCHLPKKPPNNQILGYNLKKKDQKFKRLILPDWYEDRRLEEEFEQDKQQKLIESGELKHITYFDPVCEKFRKEAWQRRLYGIWIFINGKPYYLTGPTTYYLDWCRFDHKENDGYPIYYDSIRRRYYFKEYCQQDPYCLGYIEIGPRGYGKTSEVVSIVLHYMTMPPHRSICAIQSKTKDDAKDKIMKGKMIPVYNELPHFFKPTSNHGSNPETYLSFFRPKKGGKQARKVKYGPDYELSNKISIFSAKEKAIDGDTCQEVIQDEIGKTSPTEEADVYKRIQVVRDCVYRNHRKVGMIRAMSTVEEMDEGGAECFKVYITSNIDQRSENGYTVSGLYPIFIPDYEITHVPGIVDEFGFVDHEKAKEYHDRERKAREGDPIAYNSYVRKHPRDLDDAFTTDATKCLFHHKILNDRYTELKKLKDQKNLPYVRGDFYWVDGKVDGVVGFKRNDSNGKFNLAKILDATGDEFEGDNKLCNNVGLEVDHEGNKNWIPKNDRLFVIGCDPIRFRKTEDNRASKAAAHCFEKLDPVIESGKPKSTWLTNNLIMEYMERPDRPEDAAEDMIMACRYFGCSINIEGNVPTFVQHFKTRGYYEFCIVKSDFDDDVMLGKPSDEPYDATEEVIQDYIGRIQSFVIDHGHRIPFERTINQLLKYNRKDHTKYDLIPSLGFTLYGVLKRQEDDWEEVDLDDIMDVVEYEKGRLVALGSEREEVSELGDWDF